MKKSKIVALLFCVTFSLICYSQDKTKMQIWMKDGNMYQLPVETVDSITFKVNSEFRNWNDVLRFPSLYEIKRYNNTSDARSPYIAAWLDTDTEENFTQFSIDFKADYVPTATYCSPFNFHMDYSSLLEKYDSVNTDGHVSVYGGLQRQIDKSNSILSLWDVYCKKGNGERDTIRATLVNPINKVGIRFSHEGNGVSYRPDYAWEPRKWYRMLIQLGKSEVTGNTTIEQWIGDLSKKEWNQLCVFDLGTPNLKFKGKTAVFLENFNEKSSGEIRTLEFKNIRIYSRQKQRWINVYSGLFYNDDSEVIKKSGSYQYGTDDDTFWMITTGVPGCATPQDLMPLTVNYSEEGDPLNLNSDQ